MWSSSRFREWLLATYNDDVWRKRLRPALRRLVVDTLTSTQVERLAINEDSQGLRGKDRTCRRCPEGPSFDIHAVCLLFHSLLYA